MRIGCYFFLELAAIYYIYIMLTIWTEGETYESKGKEDIALCQWWDCCI
jgi:hypothetical protein